MKTKHYYLLALSIAAVVVIMLARRSNNVITVQSPHRPVMGAFARIIVTAKDKVVAQKCIDSAFEQLELVDNLMSTYKSDSEISIVNRDAHSGAVKVSGPVFKVLQRSIYFSEQTEGAFDITIGPLIDLWRSAEEANSLPTAEELQQVKMRVGYDKLILDANSQTIAFAAIDMKVNLGGIAKGYAIDLATEAIKAAGGDGAMVDVGGDIRCFGLPSNGKKTWVIGLQNPVQAGTGLGDGEVILKLKLLDSAVTTSGDYRRFVTINGKKYSHIIDPATASSAKKSTSVTIIAASAIDADALATAVSVLGTEKGIALIESIANTEAIIMPADSEGAMLKTSGADEFIY